LNSTFRRVLAAGLGSLAVTEKAVRQLVDDLIKKGDLSRSQGEKLLDEARKKFKDGRGTAEKSLEETITRTLDRIGLARKSDLLALEHRLQRLEGGRSRSRASAVRVQRAPRRKRGAPASGDDEPGK